MYILAASSAVVIIEVGDESLPMVIVVVCHIAPSNVVSALLTHSHYNSIQLIKGRGSSAQQVNTILFVVKQ